MHRVTVVFYHLQTYHVSMCCLHRPRIILLDLFLQWFSICFFVFVFLWFLFVLFANFKFGSCRIIEISVGIHCFHRKYYYIEPHTQQAKRTKMHWIIWHLPTGFLYENLNYLFKIGFKVDHGCNQRRLEFDLPGSVCMCDHSLLFSSSWSIFLFLLWYGNVCFMRNIK